MATKNDITGDTIITKGTTDKYRDNWDAIFGKPKVTQDKQEEKDNVDQQQ